ncbi:MAG: DUF86 domain-containing protein [Methanolobus sp.]|nr:DUF86 domain-containing protein [Methanolobus sp.]
MNKREAGDYLEDILNSMLAIQEFTEDYSYDNFTADKKTQYAVIRAIEIIGEASKNVPSTCKEKYPDIPWREMGAMRDRLIHGYFGVDLIFVWDTVKKDIPPLISFFQRIVDEMD